jgi:hypothetical protein
MKTCARMIAGLFAIVFVLSALLAMALWNLDHFLLDSEAYKQALHSEQIYGQLPSLLADQLRYSMTYNPCVEDPAQCEGVGPEPSEAEGEGGGGPPSYFRELDEHEWEAFLEAMLPETWMQAQTESVLDQLFANLGGTDPRPIHVSLDGLKRHLTGPGGDQALQVLLEAQPPCTEVQLLEQAQPPGPEPEMDLFLACQPPDDILEANQETIRAEFHSLVRGWPQTTDLSFGFLRGEAGEQAPDRLEDAGATDALRLFRSIARWSPLIPLICLLVIAPFAVRSKADACRWWGTPVLIVGVVGALAALAVNPLLRWGAGTFLLPRVPGGLSPSFVQLVLDVVFQMSRGMALRVLLQAGMLGLVGIVLLVLARRSAHSPTAAQA